MDSNSNNFDFSTLWNSLSGRNNNNANQQQQQFHEPLLLSERNNNSSSEVYNNRRSIDDSVVDDEDHGCDVIPNLTWNERLIGFVTCLLFGYVLSFGSFFRIKELILGNPAPFVFNTTLGNMIALCGSFFLSGPKSQINKMFHETRKISTIIYLSSLGLTLTVALLFDFDGIGFILFILCIFQYMSLTWYMLSYIPFARQFVRNYCFGNNSNNSNSNGNNNNNSSWSLISNVMFRSSSTNVGGEDMT